MHGSSQLYLWSPVSSPTKQLHTAWFFVLFMELSIRPAQRLEHRYSKDTCCVKETPVGNTLSFLGLCLTRESWHKPSTATARYSFIWAQMFSVELQLHLCPCWRLFTPGQQPWPLWLYLQLAAFVWRRREGKGQGFPLLCLWWTSSPGYATRDPGSRCVWSRGRRGGGKGQGFPPLSPSWTSSQGALWSFRGISPLLFVSFCILNVWRNKPL